MFHCVKSTAPPPKKKAVLQLRKFLLTNFSFTLSLFFFFMNLIHAFSMATVKLTISDEKSANHARPSGSMFKLSSDGGSTLYISTVRLLGRKSVLLTNKRRNATCHSLTLYRCSRARSPLSGSFLIMIDETTRLISKGLQLSRFSLHRTASVEPCYEYNRPYKLRLLPQITQSHRVFLVNTPIMRVGLTEKK